LDSRRPCKRKSTLLFLSRSFSPRFVSWTSPQPEVAANRRS
jgi:hypothetical protein